MEASSREEYLLPAVIFADGRVLHRPTIGDLADARLKGFKLSIQESPNS
jgi:hypothetical protein